MQCDNANQYILMIYNGQKLHRGWRCFHLFHCLHCHCIWTNGSRLPEITKRLLVICSGCLCHSLLSFKMCVCVCISLCVFTSKMFFETYFYRVNPGYTILDRKSCEENQITDLVVLHRTRDHLSYPSRAQECSKPFLQGFNQ